MSEAKKRNIVIATLCAVVLLMGVGYAAFNTQLNINSTASVTSSWDVHIKSITAGTPVGTASDAGTNIGSDKLSATFNTNLVSPGDTITYTIVVENAGSLDAKLNSLTFDGGSNTAILHTYAGIATGDVITAGKTATFTVTVKYNPDITSQPENTTSSVAMTLNYVQSV